MDYIKNKCPVCKKVFCCSAHRADHEVKNHPEEYPKLTQEVLVQLFQKRAKTILLKSQNRQASDITKKEMNYVNENTSNKSNPTKPTIPEKRAHSKMNRHILSASLTVSETRKILMPVRKIPKNQFSNDKPLLGANYQPLTSERPPRTSPSEINAVKTSTPIIGNLSKEKTPTSNWDYISPASSISYYGTPNITVDGRPLFKSQSNKTTPLRSIMTKNSKFVPDSDMGPSPSFNTSRGRKVTFSFSSSRVSSTTSSPLESVQEIEVHEEIQDENREVIKSVSTVKNFSEREISTGVQGEKNYVLEVTSFVNGNVHTCDLGNETIASMQRFTDDSLASFKGGLFSCVTNMFCSAIRTFPLWRGSGCGSRSKRSRSPDRELENLTVQSPRQKRPCYPRDLRLNPIRARKPISQP